MERVPGNDSRDGREAERKKKRPREEVEARRRPNGLVLASLIISLFAVELTLVAGPYDAHLSCQSAEGRKPENSFAALSARHWQSTGPSGDSGGEHPSFVSSICWWLLAFLGL